MAGERWEEAGLVRPAVARGGAMAYKRGGGVRRKSTSFGFGGQQARLFVSFFLQLSDS